MPLVDNAHYVDSVGWTAVTAWATATAKTAGAIGRQNATPTQGNERVFICIVAGTTHATTEPTWVLTRGAKTTDNTVTWQECTGLSAINGDMTNTPTWAEMKAITSSGVLGQVILNNAETHVFIMSTAGTIGASQPSFNTTAGATTADNTATWTSLGAVGTFTGNQAPHARITNCLTTNWTAAGNSVFLKDTHDEAFSGTASIAGAGTIASPLKVLCHDGGAYPPTASNVSTGATLTGTSNILLTGIGYWEGLHLVSSSTGATSLSVNGDISYFKNGLLSLTGNNAAPTIVLGAVGSRVIIDNTQFSFANVGQDISVLGMVDVINTANCLQGAAVPTGLLNYANESAIVNLRGLDLSAAGAGVSLVQADPFSGDITFINCKLGASVTPAATPTSQGYSVKLINCDSGDVNYNTAVYHYTGTLTTEITVVLSGGATDGTTPISWKVITTANAKLILPFECPPIAIWNETTGSSVTATIQGIWGGGAVPDDDEIWVDFEYLGTSGFPLSSISSDRAATILTTPAGQAAGTGTWGGSTTKFALSQTFTPQEKGMIVARVKVGLASATFYIDPKITLT